MQYSWYQDLLKQIVILTFDLLFLKLAADDVNFTDIPLNTAVFVSAFALLWPYQRALNPLGSGCGSVGRMVASDSRGPQFESSHCKNLHCTFTVNCIEKTKIKNKRPEWSIFKKEPWTQNFEGC